MHGGWVGGWYWKKIVPLLEVAGHRVETPDLPGHGDDRTPIPEVSLQSYADRVCQVLDSSPEPAVLVGHSMGGLVISQAAEQRPEKVETLSAMVMDEDQTYATVREDAVKETFGADCPDEDVERIKSLNGPQALSPLATPLAVTEAFGRIPRVYIECLRDRAITPATQKEMYGRTPCRKVISMNTSHLPLYAAPEELAGHLSSLSAREGVAG